MATPANFPKPTVVSPELSAKDSEPAVAVPGLPVDCNSRGSSYIQFETSYSGTKGFHD